MPRGARFDRTVGRNRLPECQLALAVLGRAIARC